MVSGNRVSLCVLERKTRAENRVPTASPFTPETVHRTGVGVSVGSITAIENPNAIAASRLFVMSGLQCVA
jgi:hypothetical protein